MTAPLGVSRAQHTYTNSYPLLPLGKICIKMDSSYIHCLMEGLSFYREKRSQLFELAVPFWVLIPLQISWLFEIS